MTERGERDPATSWELGRRLEEARGSLSLEKVAEQAGLTRETVRYYELGYRADNGKTVTPRPRTLRAIAQAVGMPVREAFELGGVDPKHLLPEERQEPDHRARLIAKVNYLDDEATNALEVLVDQILRREGYVAPDAPRPDEHDDPRRPTVVSHPPQPGLDDSADLGGQLGVGDPPAREPIPGQQNR